MAQRRKETFRKAIQDYGNLELDKPFNQATDVQRAFIMAKFYAKHVLAIVQQGLVPEDDDDIAACITDGANDQGADCIFRQDGHVLILQAKYRGRKKAEDEADVEHFFDILRRLHPISGAEHKKNQRVLDATSDINWKSDTFELQFITLGEGSEDIRTRERQGQRPIPGVDGLEDLEDRCDLLFVPEKDLNDNYRDALSASQGIQDTLAVQFDPSDSDAPWVQYVSPTGRRSYIGKIKAGNLKKLYEHRGARYKIFAQNIRNYVGDTSTNKNIIKTAVENPSDFFFFNNGIAAVATRIDENSDDAILNCERFSIINGAQTVRSLVKAFNKARAAGTSEVSSVEVLMRVSEVSYSRKLDDQVFLDNITKYNNTQNAIKISDFRSNDPVQISLSKKFAKIVRGGKKYWYKNKRTGEQKQNTIAISLDDFTKTLHAFRYGPADMFGGTRYLFDTGPEGGYPKVFGDGTRSWEHVDDDSFRNLAGTWFLCEAIRYYWKKLRQEWPKNYDEDDTDLIRLTNAALERRFLVFFTVGELLRARAKLKNRSIDDDVIRLCKPNWLDDNDDYLERVADLTEQACEILIRTYRTGHQNPDFVHRNWFRSQNTLREIRNEIQTSPSMVKRVMMITE